MKHCVHCVHFDKACIFTVYIQVQHVLQQAGCHKHRLCCEILLGTNDHFLYLISVDLQTGSFAPCLRSVCLDRRWLLVQSHSALYLLLLFFTGLMIESFDLVTVRVLNKYCNNLVKTLFNWGGGTVCKDMSGLVAFFWLQFGKTSSSTSFNTACNVKGLLLQSVTFSAVIHTPLNLL